MNFSNEQLPGYTITEFTSLDDAEWKAKVESSMDKETKWDKLVENGGLVKVEGDYTWTMGANPCMGALVSVDNELYILHSRAWKLTDEQIKFLEENDFDYGVVGGGHRGLRENKELFEKKGIKILKNPDTREYTTEEIEVTVDFRIAVQGNQISYGYFNGGDKI
ncbi:MAG: hypothetical protein ABI721_02480 [Candidatus Dojkabacteria bacterium]